ncbi:hypothetical protein M0R36_08220 [bacterium]|jgi:hypothetical protein|nr:hypothetical protein [bacterium]
MTGKFVVLSGILLLFFCMPGAFCDDDNVVSESVKSVGNLVVETTKAVGNVLETTAKTFDPDENPTGGNKGYIISDSDIDERSKEITQAVSEDKFSGQKYRGKLTTGTYNGK